MRNLATLLCLLLSASRLAAADEESELLFDIPLDMDRNGIQDRAALVLVGPGRTDFAPLTKELYNVEEDERIDLYIYLGWGNALLDIKLKPTMLKQDIFGPSEVGGVTAPSTNTQGSLVLQAGNGWGSNQYVETLTVVYRKGEFLVGGVNKDWDTRNTLSRCDFNLLTGKAFREDGPPGSAKTKLPGTFRAVKLADWSKQTRTKVCDEE
jgi:hypothetical protein